MLTVSPGHRSYKVNCLVMAAFVVYVYASLKATQSSKICIFSLTLLLSVLLSDNVLSDINECATNSGSCSSVTTCVNTVGSFFCTCNIDYAGNGFSCSGGVYISASMLLNEH